MHFCYVLECRSHLHHHGVTMKLSSNTDHLAALRAVLKRNGFVLAASAKSLQWEIKNHEYALHTWDSFPQCMNKFPKQLTKKATYEPKTES